MNYRRFYILLLLMQPNHKLSVYESAQTAEVIVEPARRVVAPVRFADSEWLYEREYIERVKYLISTFELTLKGQTVATCRYKGKAR